MYELRDTSMAMDQPLPINHTYFVSPVTSLLTMVEQHAQQPYEQVVRSGSFLPHLERTQGRVQADLNEHVGVPTPLAVSFQGYTLSKGEKQALQSFANNEYANSKLYKSYVANVRNLNSQHGEYVPLRAPYDHIISELRQRAAKIRKQAYYTEMSFEALQPQMMLEESLEAPSTLNLAGSSFSITCARLVFAMNAFHLLGKDVTLSKGDRAFVHMLSDDFLGGSENAFNLGWLLGALGSEIARRSHGHKVAVRTLVGMDFGEIQDKYLKPIRARNPAARFILNAVLTSETSHAANHVVTVTDSNEEQVSYHDPYHDKVNVDHETFWDRWTPTNMQAVLVAALPSALSK